MRGELVIVRAFGGKALKRRVWDIASNLVYLTSDEQFEKLLEGKPAAEPIGFPEEDIFCLAEDGFVDGPIEWSQLVPWRSAAGRPHSSAGKDAAH